MTSLNKLGLLILVTAISSMHCQAQFTQPPDHARKTGRVQQVYLADPERLAWPVEYPIDGTPFYNDDYLKGIVYTKHGNATYDKMRYNIYYNRIELEEKGSLQVINQKLFIEKILIDSQTFVVENLELKGELIPGYFLRLDSGKVTLLTKMTVTFKDRQVGKPIEGNIPAKYQRQSDSYYVKQGNEPLTKVRSIKKLIDELPEAKMEMEKFAKKEKISAKNAEELTKFIQYYNSLQ